MAVKTANISVHDEMDEATFDAIMQRGLDEAKAGKGRPAADVIANLRKEL